MNVSVVVPTIFARPDLLADCLRAAGPAVVTTGGTFAENCNRGATIPSDIIVFLNDDTIVPDGWLDPLLAPFEDPRVGIVGCRLIYPNGTVQHSGVYLDTPGGVLTAYNDQTDGPSRYVEAVTGACMAVRRDTFDELGGFDTAYRNGYEDVDLCLRARTSGWRVWYTADVTVIHHESQSGPARWAHVRENVHRLQEVWRGNHHLV